MGEKNNLLSAVASDDVVHCVEHLVEYLSCRVFGQAMYRHVTYIAAAVTAEVLVVVFAEVIAEILAEAVTADILADVTADVFAEVLPEVLTDVAGRTELEVRVEIQQLEELEVLLVAVRC